MFSYLRLIKTWLAFACLGVILFSRETWFLVANYFNFALLLNKLQYLLSKISEWLYVLKPFKFFYKFDKCVILKIDFFNFMQLTQSNKPTLINSDLYKGSSILHITLVRVKIRCHIYGLHGLQSTGFVVINNVW